MALQRRFRGFMGKFRAVIARGETDRHYPACMPLEPRHHFRRSIEMLSAAECPACHLALDPNRRDRPPCSWCETRAEIVKEYWDWVHEDRERVLRWK